MGSFQHESEFILPEIFLNLGLTEHGKRVNEFPCVLTLLSSVFVRIIHRNELILESKERQVFSLFDGLRIPSITIKSYIERIFKYSKCSPSCFVLAYIYIDRFLQKPNTYLTSVNVHRLLITATTVAAKFIDDAFFNNAYYARIGGVTTSEMNWLELNFLFSLDFRLHVSLGTFKKYCLQLEMAASGFQIERPVSIFKDWTKVEDSNHQFSLQKCS